MAYEIVIPRLGWSMEEGTFVGWLKRDGDNVKRGDLLFELEGEKAAQDIEAVDDGILRIPPTGPESGSTIKVGAVIGYLVAVGEELSGTTVIPPVTAPIEVAAAPSVRDSSVDRAALASPRARRVAGELGVDWSRLTGTGAGGRVRERDVRAAFESQRGGEGFVAEVVRVPEGFVAEVVRVPEGFVAELVRVPLVVSSAKSDDFRYGGSARSIPVSNRRRAIADKMRASRQQTVGVTLTSRADATNLVSLRQQFKAASNLSIVPSINDIVLKLVAASLKQHPLLAGRWDGESITLPNEADLHLGLAVDTEGGLLVPVIRSVPSLSLPQIARQSRDLIERARSGKLTVAQMQGGVFTVTNLGALGVDGFTPIINSPESAILGLGAIRREPVVREDGQIIARDMLTLSLTFDHCVIDGAPAARFLQTLVSAITNPSAWLLGE